MFCPKCGKDVGEFKFCPYCGTVVPEPQAGGWSVGMACPHCGGTQLEGDRCAFCGAQLAACKEIEAEGGIEKLFRYYYDVYSGITLAKEILEVKIPGFLKSKKYRIRYDQLVQVTLFRTEDRVGRLLFRWMKDHVVERVEVPFYSDENVGNFLVLFYLIKFLSPPTALFSIGPLDNNAEELFQSFGTIDRDDYFRRFAPCRNRAAQALARDHAIPLKKASIMIDHIFEERQIKRYEEDLTCAVRDMLLILEERKRIDDEKEAEREERHRMREKYKT